MSVADVLVLGGPAAGKTHYAGQLLGRLRNDRQGILRVRAGGEDDLHQFDEVLACLEEGRPAGHTPGATWTGIKCRLQLRDGDDISLNWPDYGGERFMSIVDNRELSADWQASISAARAWLLFIRLSTLKLREDLLTRPPGHVSKPYAAGTDNIDGSAWDDRARYVEILQRLLFAANRSTSKPVLAPRLAVMWVFPLLKSLLPVVVAFLLPTTDTLDHRRVGNGTHRHGLFQEPMEELPAMA